MELVELFPVSVRAVLRQIPDEELPLTPDEEVTVAHAVSKRRREFAAGRACAREALDALGFRPSSLPRRADGCPDWPAGVVGSITHSKVWAAAVVSECSEVLGLGLDLEQTGRLSRRVAEHALSPAELEAGEADPLGPAVAWVVVFSAKESIYKCLYPTVRRYIGFREAELRLQPDGTFTHCLADDLIAALPVGSRSVGRFRLFKDHVITSFTLLES